MGFIFLVFKFLFIREDGLFLFLVEIVNNVDLREI